MADRAVQTTSPGALTDAPDEDMFSDRRLELIRRQVANGAPEDLFVAMIEIARSRGLDPLAKQISLIRFGGTWQITTTIDGYRAIAESTGAYAGSDAPIFEMRNETTSKGKPIPDSASVTVWKLVGGTRYPFSATVYWDEYAGQNNWQSMPRTMLAKVAESHALRKGFPKVLSRIYTTDEMDQAGAIETTARVVNQQTGEIMPQPRMPEAPDPQRAMKRLHAVGAKHGIDHDVFHRWAVGTGHQSINEIDAATLTALADRLEQRTEDTLARLAKYRVAEDEPVEAEHRPADDEIARMDAALASATPGSLPLDVQDAPSPDRYTN